MYKADLIVYQFSGARVESQDFSHFLGLYSRSTLSTGQGLKAMLGRMLFCIEGYDADLREIYLIPEVRRFYAAFHQAWPYWLYFSNLDTDGLNSMVICRLNSFNALNVDGWDRCRVEYYPLELGRFIAQDLPHMNRMCERAEIGESEIYERTGRVFEYFQLPFDVR